MWATIIDGITRALVELYTVTGDLGVAIIIFTLVIRALLVPLTLPSLKAQQRMKELKPEVDKLKAKHGTDKKAFQQAQLELYQRYNLNPLSGCLPQVFQIAILIVLYQSLIKFLGQTEVFGVEINTIFLWMDLAKQDQTYLIPIIAGGTQMVLSLMIAPGAEIKDEVPNQSRSKELQVANKKEEDFAEMAASMQQQMLFMMPIMTGFIAARFPAGLGLYWVVTTIFSIGQQYTLSGWGGLTLYTQRAARVLTGNTSYFK